MNELFERDAIARDRIVRDISANFFVEAGAGSGKTTVLVKRMVAMVESGIDVSRICAITFTKAAAGEFYRRFQKALIERSTAAADPGAAQKPGELGEPNDETRARCRNALTNIDLCFMGTIDSFCQMILSEHPSEAGVPSNARVLSDDELTALYRREYSRIQNGRYGEELQKLNETFRGLHRYPDEVFLKTLKTLMGIRNAELQLPEAASGTLSEVFGEDISEIRSLVTELRKHPESQYEGNAGSRDSWAVLMEKGGQLLGSWDEDIPEILGILKSISGLRLIPEFDPAGLGPFGQAYFAPHMTGKKLSWYELDKDHLPAFSEKLRNYQYDLTMAFISRCVLSIAERLKKEGALSFFDYMLYLRDMLKRDALGDGRLIRHIYERHSYFLIDEFQDTNPMQAEIFFTLTAVEPRHDWRGCAPHAGSLFIVGDPKQSIYRFRSADVSSYLQVKELFRGDVGEVLYLTRNFRSTYHMSAWFNRVFTELLPENTRDQSRFEQIPLPDEAPEADGTFGGVFTYACSDAKDALPEEKDPYRVLEVIRKLVHHPEHLIRDRNSAETRQIRYGDFMLITPGKGKIAEYTALFSEYRIPFWVEGKVVFRKCSALRDLANVFQLIALPNETRFLYAVLTGSLYRIGEKELLRLKADGLVLSIFSDNEKLPETEPIREILADLRELYYRSQEMSPAALFSLLLEHYDLFRTTGTDHLEYVYFTLELLRSAESSGEIASLEDGANYLESLLMGDDAAERCIRLNKKGDSIHIANLHKVKGLEAPIVILAYQKQRSISPDIRIEQTAEGAKAWFFQGSKYSIITKAFEQEKDAEKHSLEEERKRLCYVAATRAERALIIGDLLTAKGEHGKGNPWLFFTERANGDIFGVLRDSSPYDPPAEEKRISEIYGQSTCLDLTAAKPKEGSFEILRPSMIKVKALTAFEDDLDDAAEDNVRNDHRKRNPALIGTIVHRLMEMLVSSKNSIDLESAIREIAGDYEAEDAYYTDILRSVGKTVQSGGFPQETDVPQDILRELLSAEEVHCEVPFCYQEPGTTNLWHGVMDVLYKKDGRWHIVDYKTNADPSDLDAKYQAQLRAYIEAFREMTYSVADAQVYHLDM